MKIKEVRLHVDKSALELERVFRMLQEEAAAYEKKPEREVDVTWVRIDDCRQINLALYLTGYLDSDPDYNVLIDTISGLLIRFKAEFVTRMTA